jgi:hypothetical protein
VTATTRGARATYLYCLLQAPRAPALRRAPAGLPGLGPPRVLPLDGGLWLVAADAPLGRYDAPAIEGRLRDLAWVSRCALGHEAVVEHVARQGPVVPMKLFTLFHGDDRALAHVRGDRRRLDRVLARVAGRQEWGLRLLLDETRARRRATVPATRRAGGAGAGTRFLLGKEAQHGAVRRLAAEGRREATRVFRALARQADAARRRDATGDPPGSRLLLDAAFLVRREAAPRFRAALREVRRRLASQGYTVVLTGPWPPYNFVGDRP